MCFVKTELDLSSIGLALIMGSIDGNELDSNGAGKSTIFRAIEYVLFNEVRDANLEEVIRDGAEKCLVIFDFFIDGKTYRVSRSRTSKGTPDFSLFERTAYQDDKYNPHSASLPKEVEKLFWENKSGRRTQDTEEDLFKITKITYRAFNNTQHFSEDERGGLPALPPEKRKQVLKESLQLLLYAKLEKIANKKSVSLLKELEQQKMILTSLGEPANDLNVLQEQEIELERLLVSKNYEINNQQEKVDALQQEQVEVSKQYNIVELKLQSLLKSKSTLLKDISDLENQKSITSSKRKRLLEEAKQFTEQLNKLIKPTIDLSISNKDELEKSLSELIEKSSQLQAERKNKIQILEELKIPMPNDAVCRHCRQPLTKEHRKVCQATIDQQIADIGKQVASFSQEIKTIETKRINIDENLLRIKKFEQDSLRYQQSKSTKEQELAAKKSLFEEYSSLFNVHLEGIEKKNVDLASIEELLQQANSNQLDELKVKITSIQTSFNLAKKTLLAYRQELQIITNKMAIVKNQSENKKKDLSLKKELENKIIELETQYSTYPLVSQAFSSKGIPNLIIQNILDDLQLESNNLLGQLKPGLQLKFEIEKTRSDGEQDETLDIKYYLNGKERSYGLLSSAMKIMVMFSLKMGLSFLLSKMMGTNIKMLLLDEVDRPLAPAKVDTYAEIIRFFAKDYTILVITHNDRLKDKFSTGIQVQQDQNMISTAKIVSL